MNQLQRINALLELDVLVGKLSLVLNLAKLLLEHLLRARSKGREVRTSRNKKQEQIMSAGRDSLNDHSGKMRHDSSTKTSNALDPGKRGVLPEVLSERLHSVHDGGRYG